MELVRFPRLTFDRVALELVVVFAIVLGLAGVLSYATTPEIANTVSPPEQFGDGAEGEATAGAALAVVEVAYAALLVALYFVYKRLPEWLQTTVRRTLVGGGAMAAGAYYGYEVAAVFAGLYFMYRILDHLGLYWIANNLLSVCFAAVYGWLFGLLFGVAGMTVLLVGLTVYDHVFANKRTWMKSLAELITKLRAPALFIRPNKLRFQWEELVAEVAGVGTDNEGADRSEEGMSWALGTADLMTPAAFVSAVITAPGDALIVGGVAAGVVCVAGTLVACCRLRFEMLSRGSVAGLPALSAGVLVPYAAVVAANLIV